jgi:hypothetical protein
MNLFVPRLERLERNITDKVQAEVAKEIPPEWYEGGGADSFREERQSGAVCELERVK